MPVIVKIFGLYFPASAVTLLLYCFTRIDNNADNKVLSVSLQRTKTIRAILKKWNKKKFNPLGFSWSYSEETDSLELSIDADLEVMEEHSERLRKSLKSS